jgi:hypothetical protein
MRALLIFAISVVPAAAQTPQVRFVNLSHPFSNEVQIGDRFEVQITGAPAQAISVRTVRQGWTDWGPAIATTDNFGRWATSGQFEKSDFGGWSEIWTVGGKLATPALQFSVKAPCLPGGHGMAFGSGPNMSLTCDVAAGSQTFGTPSTGDSFRTPDGRSVVLARPSERTQEQYHMEILTDLISGGSAEATRVSLSSSRGGLGDGTAELISKMIGVNALSEKEIQNVLAVVRGAFEKPETIAPGAREPSRTLVLLRHLSELADQDGLKRQIAGTIAYLQAR